MELAGLRTVVGQWLWARKTPYALVAPATLKVYATGRGTTQGENRVTKQEVRERVTATYGHLVHIGDDNQADSIALLAMTLDAYGEPLVAVPETHRRALKAVSWPELPVRPEVAAALAGAAKAGPT
jgi:crossover junction endodeoxyribonuclease RuvC